MKNAAIMQTANSKQPFFVRLKDVLKKHKLTYIPLHFIKDKLLRVKHLIRVCFYLIRNFLCDDIIFGQTCARARKLHTSNYGNWGDALSCSFIEYATGKKVAVFNLVNNFLPIRRYVLIGSIISFYNLRNSIIYGTGIMSDKDTVKGKPRKIISVRGPLTRKALIKKGIDCPEKYGDPALLLPLFYSPKPERRSENLLIPNLTTADKTIIDRMTEEYHCSIISMTSYDKWTDIIDRIILSEFVISESLHGLIVAETYGIPSVWVEFAEHKNCNNDWYFKYMDFYESIGKHDMRCLKLYERFSFEELMHEKDKWKPGKIDYAGLLSLFPFEIKPEFMSNIKKFLQTN